MRVGDVRVTPAEMHYIAVRSREWHRFATIFEFSRVVIATSQLHAFCARPAELRANLYNALRDYTRARRKLTSLARLILHDAR